MVNSMNTKIYKKLKGFTLVEMMIAIFIFLLMMIAIVQIFAQQIVAYRHARSVQNDMENAQFAMNYIAKTLRTASVIGSTEKGDLLQYMQDNYLNDDFAIQQIGTLSSGGEGLMVYDFSQEKCLKFTFRPEGYGGYAEPALWVVDNGTEFVAFNEIERCAEDTVYVTGIERRLTTGNVTGAFAVAPTRYQNIRGSKQTDTIGRATTIMKVLPAQDKLQRGVDPVPIHLQTTASLRDYPPDLSF
jgi:prepilin-type N-terminal cleavage/methylation domain-containing protein